MSVLRNGDQDLHYSDSSHRWIAPPDVEQKDWDAAIRIHMDQHRLGGKETMADELPARPIPRHLRVVKDGEEPARGNTAA